VNDLAAFARKVDKVLDEIDDPGLFRAVGMAGKKLGTAAVQNDIGDTSMSNWRRGRPINLSSRFDVVSENTVEIAPGKRARGPVRVLNEGRKPGVSRRGRPVSGSRGKNTWSDATEAMERELPRVAHEHVTRVLRKHF
jgi:hypothetical protein